MIEVLGYIFNAPIPTILVCAGIFLIILPLINIIPKKIEVRTSNRIASGLIGIIFLGIGLYLSGFLPYPVTPTITVEINSPQDDAIILYNNTIVSGIASNVPEDKYLWVFVRHEMNNNIYPSGGRILISQDKKWRVETWLNKSGMKYEICAALADERADEELQNYANTREEKGYPGILTPKGITVYSTVNVTQE